MDPGADGGERTFQRMPTRVELQLGSVVVVGGPHAADETEVVRHLAEIAPPITDGEATLTVLLEPDLHRVNLGMHLMQSFDYFPQVLLDLILYLKYCFHHLLEVFVGIIK